MTEDLHSYVSSAARTAKVCHMGVSRQMLSMTGFLIKCRSIWCNQIWEPRAFVHKGRLMHWVTEFHSEKINLGYRWWIFWLTIVDYQSFEFTLLRLSDCCFWCIQFSLFLFWGSGSCCVWIKNKNKKYSYIRNVVLLFLHILLKKSDFLVNF